MNVPDSMMDTGLEDVEIMVNAKREPNELNLKALDSLYYARAVNYWRKLEEFYEDINNVRRNSEKANFYSIKKQLPEFFEMFKRMLDKEERNVEAIFKKYMDIFVFMAKIFCVKHPYETTYEGLNKIKALDKDCKLTKNKYTMAPFINYTGEFGFNTFLYAFFNNISLIGIPSGYSSFDSETGCSYDFYIHDIDHHSEYHKQTLPLFCRLYKAILNSKYNEYDKKIALIVLWIIVHENYYITEKERNPKTRVLQPTEIFVDREEFSQHSLSKPLAYLMRDLNKEFQEKYSSLYTDTKNVGTAGHIMIRGYDILHNLNKY